MDVEFRKEQVKKLPPKRRSASSSRISIASTRCPMSRSSRPRVRRARSALPEGTSRRRRRRRHHHLSGKAERARGSLFSYPRYVHQRGRDRGRGRRRPNGDGRPRVLVRPAYDDQIEDYIRPLFQKVYTMSFENYRRDRAAPASQRNGVQVTGAGHEHDHADPQRAARRSARSGGPLARRRWRRLSNEAIRALPVYLGKRQCRLDDFFTVEGEPATSSRSAVTRNRSSGSAAA